MPLFEAEKSIIQYQIEHMLFFDEMGNLLNQIVGNEKTVPIPIDVCFNNRGKICSHNHKHCNPHSPKDVLYAIYNEMAQSRVVSTDYLYVLHQPSEGWKPEDWDNKVLPDFLSLYKDETGYSYDKVINKHMVSTAPDDWEFTEEGKAAFKRIWMKIFNDMRVKYEIEKLF